MTDIDELIDEFGDSVSSYENAEFQESKGLRQVKINARAALRAAFSEQAAALSAAQKGEVVALDLVDEFKAASTWEEPDHITPEMLQYFIADLQMRLSKAEESNDGLREEFVASCIEATGLRTALAAAERQLGMAGDAVDSYAEFYQRCCKAVGLPGDCNPCAEVDEIILRALSEKAAAEACERVAVEALEFYGDDGNWCSCETPEYGTVQGTTEGSLRARAALAQIAMKEGKG